VLFRSFAVAAGGLGAGVALADVTAATHSAGTYRAGENLAVAGAIEHAGGVTAMGLLVALPAGWSFVAAEGAGAPQIVPAPGTTGTLEFAWFTIPASPVQFTYSVAVPAGASGAQNISGTVLYRTTGAEQQLVASPSPLLTQPAAAPPPAGDGGGGGGGGGCFVQSLARRAE